MATESLLHAPANKCRAKVENCAVTRSVFGREPSDLHPISSGSSPSYPRTLAADSREVDDSHRPAELRHPRQG